MTDKRIFVICPSCHKRNYEYDVCAVTDSMVEFKINCCGCKQSITHRDSFVPNIMPQGGLDKNMLHEIINEVKESFGFPKKDDASKYRVK